MCLMKKTSCYLKHIYDNIIMNEKLTDYHKNS